jgi:HEAT repeat protein
MFRALPIVLLLSLLFVPRSAAREDEPSVQGKKLSEWVEMLQNDSEVKHRRVAVIALQLAGVKQHNRTIAPLTRALREDASEDVREMAASALGGLAGSARKDGIAIRFEAIRDALAAALRGDKVGRVRAAAASALGRLEVEALDAIGSLGAALKDSHEGTRYAAAEALRRLGKDAAGALDKLQEVLLDAKVERGTRVQCALAIGRIGAPDALPALPALQTVLTDAKAPASLRKAVTEALGVLGKDAAVAAGALGDILTSPASDVSLRRAAATALDSIGAEGHAALPALLKAIKDTDQFVRSQALHTLGQYGKELGEQQKSVVTAILSAMDDSVLEVRLAAIEALGALGAAGLGEETKAVAGRLNDATRDPQKAVRDAATAALKKVAPMP